MAIIKILDGSTYSTLLIKLKFMCNKAVLDIVNKDKDTMIFKPEEMIGIIDLRSLGYYKIKQGILLCKAVLTVVHNCYLFLYMKCLGGLHYNSLYALSLHSTHFHHWVAFLCMLGRIREQVHVI